jgi:hypothetical protein
LNARLGKLNNLFIETRDSHTWVCKKQNKPIHMNAKRKKTYWKIRISRRRKIRKTANIGSEEKAQRRRRTQRKISLILV